MNCGCGIGPQGIHKHGEKDMASNVKAGFNPANYPDVFFPNWFDREDIEVIVGRKLKRGEWERVKNGSELSDRVSELVREYICGD